MADKLRFAMGIEDDLEKSVQEALTVIKEFLRSMKNVTLDRVEFEQRQQLVGEDFNGFFVVTQKIGLMQIYVRIFVKTVQREIGT